MLAADVPVTVKVTPRRAGHIKMFDVEQGVRHQANESCCLYGLSIEYVLSVQEHCVAAFVTIRKSA